MRTKNTFKTLVYGIVLTTIIAILGLLKTKILLMKLGDEIVGIYQLFTQLYTYLSLAEGGVGASIAYHLYEPFHNKNEKKIKEVFLGARKYFFIVGIIIISLGVILSFNIMILIKETSISSLYIKICFILYVLSSSINYFTSAHALLYEAEQKLYKSSNLNHLLSIFESIAAIIISLFNGNLLIIITTFLLLSIFKNIILVFISYKDHVYIKRLENIKPDLSFKKEANDLIYSKVGQLVNENTDILILSKFSGLLYVVIYSAYNQITNMIRLMIMRFNSALLPSVGNLLIADKEKAKSIFEELNSIVFFIGIILFAPLMFSLSPFINLWYGNSYSLGLFLSLLFTTILFLNIIKIPLETFIKAAGEFKSIKYSSIFQSVLNLLLSLILVFKYNIFGVLIATIVTFLTCNFIHYPYIVCKRIINSKISNYYISNIKYLLLLMISSLITFVINGFLTYSNLFLWILNGCLLFIINMLIVLFYYYIIGDYKMFYRIRYLFKKNK